MGELELFVSEEKLVSRVKEVRIEYKLVVVAISVVLTSVCWITGVSQPPTLSVVRLHDAKDSD